MICKCYRAEKNFLGKVGVCWGTAERDACSCGGDKSKCDFYPSVREENRKPVTNADRLRQMSDEELAKHVCCPHDQCIDLDAPCDKCVLSWLKAPADKEGEE